MQSSFTDRRQTSEIEYQFLLLNGKWKKTRQRLEKPPQRRTAIDV
jgi:hypothetical protein